MNWLFWEIACFGTMPMRNVEKSGFEIWLRYCISVINSLKFFSERDLMLINININLITYFGVIQGHCVFQVRRAARS